ncbi:hypothetical protein BDK92_3003 [Micromonospora pisi]|uniref:Uncharacterized protein n=1 Tax=Micromonospora pisi TaxID=589240 RepID=A0A495JJV6_9ACTN|nr:hypothetical protein BDK92_3003 [Micromonospora pisi]
MQLLDAGSGALLATLPLVDAFWVTNDRLMYTITGPNRRAAVEIDLNGNEVRQLPLPVELDRRLLFVGPR